MALCLGLPKSELRQMPRDCTAVKSTYCSSRGPEFGSQHLSCLEQPVRQGQEYPMSTSGSQEHYTQVHSPYTGTHFVF